LDEGVPQAVLKNTMNTNTEQGLIFHLEVAAIPSCCKSSHKSLMWSTPKPRNAILGIVQLHGSK